MEIGELRHRAQIQTYTETQQEGTAKTNKVWETIKTVWVNMNPVKGLVTFDTMQIDQTVTVKVTMRYQPYITTDHWLFMNSRRFKIKSVRNLGERNQYLELLCEEDSLAIEEFHMNVNTVGDPLRELLE